MGSGCEPAAGRDRQIESYGAPASRLPGRPRSCAAKAGGWLTRDPRSPASVGVRGLVARDGPTCFCKIVFNSTDSGRDGFGRSRALLRSAPEPETAYQRAKTVVLTVEHAGSLK